MNDEDQAGLLDRNGQHDGDHHADRRCLPAVTG
jgi:hypothetical protein